MKTKLLLLVTAVVAVTSLSSCYVPGYYGYSNNYYRPWGYYGGYGIYNNYYSRPGYVYGGYRGSYYNRPAYSGYRSGFGGYHGGFAHTGGYHGGGFHGGHR